MQNPKRRGLRTGLNLMVSEKLDKRANIMTTTNENSDRLRLNCRKKPVQVGLLISMSLYNAFT